MKTPHTATYSVDARGNTLGRCGACGEWERVSALAHVVVGRFVRKEVPDPFTGEIELKWIFATRRVEGCKDCADLFHYERIRAVREGWPTPALRTDSKENRAALKAELAMKRHIEALEALISAQQKAPRKRV